jgi:CRP-like cAMP-binding protein
MKMVAVQEFARQTGISQEVKGKIRDAVKYNTYKMGSIWNDKHSLFSELPKALRYEVAWSMYNGVAKEFPIFSFFEASFLAAVMPLFRPVQHQDSDYLYHEDDYPDEVFFITRGRVNFVLVPSEIVYKSFLRGSYLGEIEIFKKVNRVNHAICYGECEFLTLLKYDFLRFMEEFPAEARELRRIATEKANRNKQAYLETLELLKLRAAKGSLTDLAGKGRVVQAELEQDLNKTSLDLLYERAVETQNGLKENGQMFQDLSALVSSTHTLAQEALRRTGRGLADARRRGT